MKSVYCANCGTQLKITRKALPKYGKVIELVEYHECPSEPVEFTLEASPAPAYVGDTDKQKFLKSSVINKLHPSQVGTEELRDRRSEVVVDSTAPPGLLRQIRNLGPDNDE